MQTDLEGERRERMGKIRKGERSEKEREREREREK